MSLNFPSTNYLCNLILYLLFVEFNVNRFGSFHLSFIVCERKTSLLWTGLIIIVMMLLDCSSNFCCMTLVRLELVEWGVRRETSAKGPNKTVCQAVRNRRQFWWHTHNTNKHKYTHTLAYRPKYRSLLVNLHGNMQMSLLARCQCQRQTPARGHWRLSSFHYCFIFVFFFFSENIFLRIYSWK